MKIGDFQELKVGMRRKQEGIIRRKHQSEFREGQSIRVSVCVSGGSWQLGTYASAGIWVEITRVGVRRRDDLLQTPTFSRTFPHCVMYFFPYCIYINISGANGSLPHGYDICLVFL